MHPSLAWWRLALRNTWRDWRSGELRLLVSAVVLAVSALAAVGFLADRMRASLVRDAAQLLGGDLVVAADQSLPAQWVQDAQAQGLRTAQTVSFPSMARAPESRGGEFRLVSVKAVSDAYPLRGAVQTFDAQGATRAQTGGPRPGEVWVDASLLEGLGLAVGDMLLLGESELRIAQSIALEPDRGAGFMGFSPRVMLHLDDLAGTGLVQPASRVTHRLLLAGGARQSPGAAATALQTWRERHEPNRAADGVRGLRIDGLESGRPEMRQTLDRAEKFLGLVALLTALLAAVAVAIAAGDFSARHVDACAVLRVLGVRQRDMARAYALEFALVGAWAALWGVVLGWLLHHGFVWALQGLVRQSLPAPGWTPAAVAAGSAWVLVLGFGLPPVLRLSRVPPLRVIRRELGPPGGGVWLALVAAVAAFALLLGVTSSDVRLTGTTLVGFALALGVFAVAAAVALWGLRWGVPRALARWTDAAGRLPSGARALQMATRQLTARPALAVLQVSALSVGLLAMLLLVLLRTDLIATWRAATPADAPNRFVINIQPEQGAPFRSLLDAAGVRNPDWYPMVRGRLVAINGTAAEAQSFRDDRARRLVEREFNLSYSAELPGHNRVVAGQWTPEEADGVSVEEGLAASLGLRLGDRLEFEMAGQRHSARITSLRKVEWSSMRVNFFVLYPWAKAPTWPSTTIAAYRVDAAAAKALDRQLLQSFPNITQVDVGASVEQVQRVLDQVIRAVEFLFAFTVAAGLLVMMATLSATREARVREYAIFRALGAGRGLLAATQRWELLGVGALAGALAGVAAAALGMVLAQQVFEFSWAPSPWALAGSVAAGAVLAWIGGSWGLRAVLRRPVVQTLRQAQG